MGELAALGITSEPGFQTLIFDQGQDNWEAIEKLFDDWGISPIIEMVPSKAELERARHLMITASKVNGYPQPESNEDSLTPYLNGVYSLEHFNPKFGAPKGQQIGPIRLKKEPSMGRTDFMQVHWLHDLLLVKKTTYETYLQKMQIDFFPIVDYKSEKEFDNIVQLKSQGFAESPLELTDSSIVNDVFFETHTGVKRFQLTGLGVPCFEEDPGPYDFFQSREYFGGDGHASNRLMFVSQRFFKAYKENGLRGLNFYPALKST